MRSWSFGPWQYPVIIDNMMTLGPLEWGAKHGGNSSWGVDAATHAQTTITYLVRSNGSTYEMADFNPTTGAFIANYTYAGLSVNSTWSRGQAWALYGFVQAYHNTKNPAFLTTAEQLAAYFFNNLPPDHVPYWDFDAPASPTTPRDTSAAAIGADGLIMLSTVAATQAERATYLKEAREILASLSVSYLAPASGEAVLTDGTDSVPGNDEVDTALIFGDYYFTEALLRLQYVDEGKAAWWLYNESPSTVLAAASEAASPEPSTWAMMLLGFAGLGFRRLSQGKKRAVASDQPSLDVWGNRREGVFLFASVVATRAVLSSSEPAAFPPRTAYAKIYPRRHRARHPCCGLLGLGAHRRG